MSEQRNPQAIEFVMEQIEKSGQSKVEIQHVLGALSLWKAAHGDFDLPETRATTTETMDAPANTELDRTSTASPDIVVLGNASLREPEVIDGEGVENMADLTNTLNAIFAPYVAGTNMSVQHADRLQNRQKIGEYKWHDTQVLDGKVTNVFFKAPYRTISTYNEALGLEVAYTRRTKPHRKDLRIQLDFTNGGVSKLTLRREGGSPHTPGYSAPSGMLNDLLATIPSNKPHLPADWEPWDTGILKDSVALRDTVHTFSLQGNVVEIISKDEYRTITRRFDPKENVFRSNTQGKYDKLPTVSERTLEPSLVTSFISGLLEALPRLNNEL